MKTVHFYRYELFIIGQFLILFGSILIPSDLFNSWISPVLFYANLGIGGLILFDYSKIIVWKLLSVYLIVGSIFFASAFFPKGELIHYSKLIVMFFFYLLITIALLKQTWRSNEVNNRTIMAVIAGFINLGLLGYFLFLSVELAQPGSFSGFAQLSGNERTEQTLYFSFVTLLTIGFGDIVPENGLAQKATILVGLVGQLYLVILTAIIIGKYISNRNQ